MKFPAMEQTESISDVLCDVCGDSTRVEGYGLQFGTLCDSWGYGSTHDGERYCGFHADSDTHSTRIRTVIPR